MIPQCDSDNPEVEHTWEWDETQLVYGTYRDVQVDEDGHVTVDTCSWKDWDVASQDEELRCTSCGLTLNARGIHVDWI
jgi:hypothetical protein